MSATNRDFANQLDHNVRRIISNFRIKTWHALSNAIFLLPKMDHLSFENILPVQILCSKWAVEHMCAFACKWNLEVIWSFSSIHSNGHRLRQPYLFFGMSTDSQTFGLSIISIKFIWANSVSSKICNLCNEHSVTSWCV